MIRAITLDCAETLVKVRWAPGTFALDCAREVGLELEQALARSIYERKVYLGRAEYERINLTGDADQCVEWWRKLTIEWLAELGHGAELVEPIMTASAKMLYEPPDRYFELYDDVIPALDQLAISGYSLNVLSNWDYSIHRVVRAHKLYERFDHVIASLEEGVEKPDARLFEIAAKRIGFEPDQILHVGDNPSDDLKGALNAGFRAALLDRNAADVSEFVVPSLTSIPEWIAQFGGD